MSIRFGVVALLCAFAAPAAIAQPPAKDKAPADIFGLTKVHNFHLELTAREWERMQPTGGPRMFGPPGAQPKVDPPPIKPGEEPIETHRSAFGMEFPYAHANFTAGEATYKNVSLRYKGNGSYMPSMAKLKRNLKVELDHYNDKQHFLGHKSLNLNAGAADITRMHEALAYSVFRAAGVPAPRTALAEVSLTVTGKYDKEYLGLYTVVEQVDRTFLKDRFKTTKGLLMKPEGLRSLDYLGDNWEQYKGRYKPKHDATKKEAQRVIDFVKLLNRGDDETFRKEIGSYLDIEAFLRFFAANTLVANQDSFFTIGHNYYLYLHPETNKFLFIPWDLDLSFAGFPMMGSPDQQMDLSLIHPYPGENKLVERLFLMKNVRERYDEIVKELAAKGFAKETMLKDIAALEKVTKDLVAKEQKASEARKEVGGMGGMGAMFARTPDLRTFVEKRSASVESQLAGKSKGYVPTGGFGGPRPGGPLGGGLGKMLLEAMDKNKDGKVSKEEVVTGMKVFFANADKDKKGALDEKMLAEAINRSFPGPGGAPPGDRGGFGPGNFMAAPLMKRADANKDGKLTVEELVAAAEAVFVEADTEKKGELDEKQLNAAVRIVLPPPPGFGPPPGEQPKPMEPKKEEKKP